jgi:neutral ceramidase
MAEVRAGVGRTIVTPPVGTRMGGYGARDHGCEGVHDELTATALLLDDGQTRIGIVAVDVVGLAADSVARIRALAEQHGILPGQHVAVCCSHTHSGPATRAWGAGGPPNQEYVRVLEGLAATALVQAARHLQPVEAALAFGEAGFNINRRRPTERGVQMLPNPEGPVDRRVTVLRLNHADDPSGERAPLALVFSYGCHSTVMGAANYWISADYPGQARRLLEVACAADGGGIALFLQGCCANVRPNLTGPDGRFRGGTFAELRQIGYALGAEVLRAAQGGVLIALAPLAVAARKVTLPLRPLRAAMDLPWVAAVAADGGPLEPPPDFPAEIEAEVQVLRLGDFWIVALPGEVFVETGWRIAGAMPGGRERTLVTSYSNGAAGYVPAPEALQEGGYEAFPFGRPRGVFYTDDIEQRLLTAARELAAALAA